MSAECQKRTWKAPRQISLTITQLAAEQGYGRAQSRFGWLYANEFGVPVDFVQAHKWLDLATVAHYPSWDKPGGKEAAEIRDRIASVMTAMQIAEARKLAREWKPIAARRATAVI